MHNNITTYPTSNVRVVTAFDRHADQAIAIANGGAK